MPVVQSFDWPNRRIHMAAAEWHPIDVYREHRAERRTNEGARGFPPLVEYSGNIAKGGGKFTPRFMTMLEGAKIVPADGSVHPVTTIAGEVITDDASEFIDVAPLTVKPLVKYQAPAAEIITVATGDGSGASAAEIRQEIDANSVHLALLPDMAKKTADEVLNRQSDGNLSLLKMFRLLTSAMFGKVSGAGTPEVRIRDIEDTKNRIVATVDNKGNRLSVALDPD